MSSPAYMHFKTAREKSLDAFEMIKAATKIEPKNFPQIVTCAKILAVSTLFFYAFNEEQKSFTPVNLMNESALNCISNVFQAILDDLHEIFEKYSRLLVKLG